jgi:hypothetical protein
VVVANAGCEGYGVSLIFSHKEKEEALIDRPRR